MRRIMVGSQLEANNSLKPYLKNHKKAGGVAQGVGPDFKPPIPHLKKKKMQNSLRRKLLEIPAPCFKKASR
jgi:hypothetical protein